MPGPRLARDVGLLLALTAVVLGELLLSAVPALAWRSLVLVATPGTTSVGERVDVFAEGFRGRSKGSLRWGGRHLLAFTTDVHGRVRTTATVPSGSCGVVELSATVDRRRAQTTVVVGGAECDGRLTWSAPDTREYVVLSMTAPGTYDLRSDVDYVVSAPSRIDGPVHLRGGRNVVWIGGHIHIPQPNRLPASSTSRRALVISDIDDRRGDPVRYGFSRPGRIVHVEGLLMDGPGLAEGINTNAPSAVVQLQNIRVNGVHFVNSDDRDGLRGWGTNHPDVLQTWGSQRELRIDGLTGTSAYQGVFLKEDVPDSIRGPVWMRRVNLRAVAHVGSDGYRYAGHRMLSWYAGRVGQIRLDPGTVWVKHHPASGWNRARPNPEPATGFWRVRYRPSEQSAHVDEPVPGGATFTDALGDRAPTSTVVDERGTYATWADAPVRDWSGRAAGRVYSGVPADGDYVPVTAVGVGYRSPGYR